MSLVLQENAEMSSDSKKINFFETTGAYDATNNPTGWGGANDSLLIANSAELTILTPAGNAFTIDLFATGDFPTDDPNVFYQIDSSMIGYGTNQKLPDGVYRFTYKVVTNKVIEGLTTYTQVMQRLFYSNAQCCIFNMFADIDFECPCSVEKADKAKKAYLMLKSLQFASECGQVNYFSDLLNDLNKICKGSCSNC